MSIRQLRARMAHDESGMGIVEILVALMIFAIVAIGMSYSMISMTRITADASARETATNLAAAEIDRLAAITDAFTIKEDATTPKQVVVDGITFNVATNTSWVGANGSTGKCGIGGGQLQYKRIRVTVTWDNMYLQNPVRADSALAPSTRINDPTAGTILVSAIDEGGIGQAGIAVSATKTSGGAGISGGIAATDADGCTYVLKAPPGNYDLTFTKSGYINTNQVLLPFTQSVVVTAGAATPVSAPGGCRPDLHAPVRGELDAHGQTADQPGCDVLRAGGRRPLERARYRHAQVVPVDRRLPGDRRQPDDVCFGRPGEVDRHHDLERWHPSIQVPASAGRLS